MKFTVDAINLFKLGFAENIESVRRFIHQQNAGIGGQTERDEALFFLTQTHGTHLIVGRDFKFLQQILKKRVIKPGIQRRHCPCPVLNADWGHMKFFRKQKHIP